MEAITDFYGMVSFENEDMEYRTLRIKRQAKEASFAPGEDIVSLLVGPDNENSYEWFAFRKGKSISVWTKKQSGFFIMFAVLLKKWMELDHPDVFEFAGQQWKAYPSRRCCICGRTLTTPESVERGIGPICVEKY